MTERLLRSVRRLSGALARVERVVAAEQGVSVSQLRCLTALLEGPVDVGVRLTALAEEQGLAPSTMTRNTALLERRGLVARHADAHDGRAIRLRLTPSGRAQAERLRLAALAKLSQALAGFHPSDRIERAVALERVATALERAGMGPERLQRSAAP